MQDGAQSCILHRVHASMLAGKRLSFEQAAMQGPALLPAQDILAAVSEPSVPSFLR